MLCQFDRLLYPRTVGAVSAGSYMVAIYKPCEKIVDGSGNSLDRFKAVGYDLPTSDRLRYEMQGHWSKNPKHGVQFEVESFDEVIPPSRDGIIAYLSSGQIKGIGPKIAERIYDSFGDKALEVLDKEPERLLAVSGISKGKLKKICDSYLASRGARDLVAYLVPHGITPNRAVRLYREYGDEAMDIVRHHPYRLCELVGIGFKTADKIAMSLGLDRMSVERADAGLIYTLTDAESRGNLCMEKHEFIRECLKLLNSPGLTEDMLANRAARLVCDGSIVSYGDFAYKKRTAEAEDRLAARVARQLRFRQTHFYPDLEAELDQEEKLLGVKLAAEQREAVKTALTNGFSVITGGPGTGKTMIQRALLDIYSKHNPNREICCCAPTGRAARRMEETTGFPASTVHKALGLLAGDDGSYYEPEPLDADLVLVDETSMIDIYLANRLFEALKPGNQVVFVGDADQLPSVGPGAVLGEIIASGCVPVVRLDKVFRQNGGSRIAINAKLIRHANLSLEYGDDFRFIDSSSIEESANIISELYMNRVSVYGLDNVALLSPYRQKTDTCVNALNLKLRELVNPADASKPEAVLGRRMFRQGDKVMQIKNHEDVSNGDIGYITHVYRSSSETTVQVDFGDGRIKEYDSSELDMLDLGYASTIHKSQGSEYGYVIINLQCAHAIMLARPLIYTAITRGKNEVIIVGERRALCIAIRNAGSEKRCTCLAERIQKYVNKRKEYNNGYNTGKIHQEKREN